MSNPSQGLRGPNLRGYRRRKLLDLNVPPSETRDQEGSSTQAVQHRGQANQQGQSLPTTTIDVEAIDDDVIESSPRAFAEAKNNAQRVRGQLRLVVDLDSAMASNPAETRNKRRRTASNQSVINCESYINLESDFSSKWENVQPQQPAPPPPPPPPPPKEPTFSCPICMGPLVEETSTRCGHIFCKICIKAAIAAQSRCPTCRKKVTVKELIRVFLPATS